MTRKTDPIKRVELKDGAVRYRFVVDMGKKPDGRRDQRTFTYDTLKEARAERARVISDRSRGLLVKPDKATVGELCTAWLAGKRKLRPGTRRTYADALQKVTDELGAVRLTDLTKGHLDQLVTDLLAEGRRVGVSKGPGLSPRSVNLMLTTFSSAVESAVKQGVLGRNVVKLVERPAQAAAKRTTWTPADAGRFLSHVADDRLSAAWQLSLYGLRRGEVLGLRWSDVDLAGGAVTVQWARLSVAHRVEEGEPKTERSKRALPLDPELLAALTALRVRQGNEAEAAGEAYNPACLLCGEAHVVANELGQPYHPVWYGRRFAALSKAAGVPSIRLHDARHTCGSIMHARGVPTADISAWLGHSSASFTLATYVHSQAGALTAAGASLRSAFTDV